MHWERKVIWWAGKGEIHWQLRTCRICIGFKHMKYAKGIKTTKKASGWSYPSDGSVLKDKKERELVKHGKGIWVWNIELLLMEKSKRKTPAERQMQVWMKQTVRGIECICESSAHNRSWSHVNAWNRARGDKSKARSCCGRRRRRKHGLGGGKSIIKAKATRC